MTGDYVRLLADTAANTGQAAESAFDVWNRETFSLGLVNTLIYAAIVTGITFLIIKLIQHFLAKKTFREYAYFLPAYLCGDHCDRSFFRPDDHQAA